MGVGPASSAFCWVLRCKGPCDCMLNCRWRRPLPCTLGPPALTCDITDPRGRGPNPAGMLALPNGLARAAPGVSVRPAPRLPRHVTAAGPSSSKAGLVGPDSPALPELLQLAEGEPLLLWLLRPALKPRVLLVSLGGFLACWLGVQLSAATSAGIAAGLLAVQAWFATWGLMRETILRRQLHCLLRDQQPADVVAEQSLKLTQLVCRVPVLLGLWMVAHLAIGVLDAAPTVLPLPASAQPFLFLASNFVALPLQCVAVYQLTVTVYNALAARRLVTLALEVHRSGNAAQPGAGSAGAARTRAAGWQPNKRAAALRRRQQGGGRCRVGATRAVSTSFAPLPCITATPNLSGGQRFLVFHACIPVSANGFSFIQPAGEPLRHGKVNVVITCAAIVENCKVEAASWAGSSTTAWHVKGSSGGRCKIPCMEQLGTQ